MNKDKTTILNAFTYHAPTPEKVQKYSTLRTTAMDLMLLIDDLCPESREKSLAMTKIEESVMWANAAIARNE